MRGSIDALEYDLGRQLSDEERTKVKSIFRSALANILTAEVWIDRTSMAYVRHLNLKNLTDLTDFYQTESGQKILAIQPALNRDLSEAAERLLNEKQAAFAEQVDAALEQMFPEYGLGQVE